jgi:hypothetical protein
VELRDLRHGCPDRYWPVVTEFITGTAGRELAAT